MTDTRGPVVMSWSSGKDSAYALYLFTKSNPRAAVTLLSTCAAEYGRVSMHGVRTELLQSQCEAIGYPLRKVELPVPCSGDGYETIMNEVMNEQRDRGYEAVVFGDIFLEDLRSWREEKLAKVEMAAIFPLWKRDTAELARDIIGAGFKAVVTCVDTAALDAGFAGRLYDDSFLADLPASVDPCGENGEFHTFVFDGPIFSRPVEFSIGEKVTREERFRYCDLIPR